MKDRLLECQADLENTAFHDYLKQLREVSVEAWTLSDDPHKDLTHKGEKRILDRLIRDIEEAPEKIRREKEKRGRTEQSVMSKAF